MAGLYFKSDFFVILLGETAVQKNQQRNTTPGPGGRNAFSSRHRSFVPHGPEQILNRGSEHERRYFRCGRYFSVGHEWYATIREGRDIGPYATRAEAEMALARHVTDCFVDRTGHIGQLDAHGRRDATELEVIVQELASCREQARLRNENSAYLWAQQRLAEYEGHPEEHDHAGIRASALRYFLSELDS
jgi:hypothetical protein